MIGGRCFLVLKASLLRYMTKMAGYVIRKLEYLPVVISWLSCNALKVINVYRKVYFKGFPIPYYVARLAVRLFKGYVFSFVR